MNAKAKLDANEKREDLFRLADYRCVVCGKYLREGVPQLAHRVINSKHNRQELPEDVLHHPYNLIPVESLTCNSRAILRYRAADELLDKIRAEPDPEDLADYYSNLREEFAR